MPISDIYTTANIYKMQTEGGVADNLDFKGMSHIEIWNFGDMSS